MENLSRLSKETIENLIKCYKLLAKSEDDWCEELNQISSQFYYREKDKLQRVLNEMAK